MVSYTYIQKRPIGKQTGSYVIDRKEVTEVLNDVIYLEPEGKELPEDICGIEEVSEFGNGAKVKIHASKWVIDALQKRPEITKLEPA